jgi:ABC-type lipoprotein export system ATPase subunit
MKEAGAMRRDPDFVDRNESPANPIPTSHVRRVRRIFGAELAVARNIPARPALPDPGAGQIVLVSGPSGSGKSTLLRRFADCCKTPIRLDALPAITDRAVIDAIAPHVEFEDAVRTLVSCGLGEPAHWVQCESALSAGEQFRARLARCVGLGLRMRPAGVVIVDEFTSGLHRRLARCLSYTLRGLASRTGIRFVLASVHDDFVRDLRPDVHVRLDPPATVVRARFRKRPVSIRRGARIEAGRMADYRALASMHYRGRDMIGFVDKVFVIRTGDQEPPLGVVVYAHAPNELSPRNAATEGRFRGRARKLTGELRILRRLILHPDVRGCGLGHWLVRETLPRVGVRFVECLAAMGGISPVFERAGMTRIGPCPPARGRLRLRRALEEAGIDPHGDDLARMLAGHAAARRAAEDAVRLWHNASRGQPHRTRPVSSPARLAEVVRHLLGAPPIYFLWDREAEFPRTAGDRSGGDGGAADSSASHRSRDYDESCPPRTDDVGEKDRHRP